MLKTRRILLACVAGALIFSSMGASGTTQPTIAQRFRAMFVQKARAAGIDPRVVFSAPAKVTTYGNDGIARTFTRPFGEVIDHLAPKIHASVGRRSGPAGTPEVLAGNTSELFGSFYAGSTSGATCQTTTVTQSAVVPDAPFVPVTLIPLFLTPVPSTLSPVIPETSWIAPAYVAGGPVMHIKSSYMLGFHTVGTLIGSGASTAAGEPNGYPAWLPMASTLGLIQDHSIDFVGHVLGFFHTEFRTDLLGYTLCGGAGALPLSDGTAIFDNHSVLGVDAGFPDVP